MCVCLCLCVCASVCRGKAKEAQRKGWQVSQCVGVSSDPLAHTHIAHAHAHTHTHIPQVQELQRDASNTEDLEKVQTLLEEARQKEQAAVMELLQKQKRGSR